MRAIAALATATATLATSMAFAAPSAQADTMYQADMNCPIRYTSQMLTGFGDTNEYFDLYNGRLQRGYAGNWDGTWTTAYENEPWRVNKYGTDRSMSLARGATATAPAICLGEGEETFRFFYKAPGQAGSQLTVKAYIESTTGNYTYTTRIDTSAVRGWQLSPVMNIPNYSAGGIQYVTVQFINTSSSYSATSPILVDDVLVDPWRRRAW